MVYSDCGQGFVAIDYGEGGEKQRRRWILATERLMLQPADPMEFGLNDVWKQFMVTEGDGS